MNITNADYFTFNVHNSMLLIGQTGSGKSYLVHQLIKRFESAFKPEEMKYAIFDLKCIEFNITYEDGAKPEYLYCDVIEDPNVGFDKLDELANLSSERAAQDNPRPFIFIYIEECDMTMINQERFDKAVITINQNAKKANIKLIYSTSRACEATISKKILKSFDLILQGRCDFELPDYLGIHNAGQDSYNFSVNER